VLASIIIATLGLLAAPDLFGRVIAGGLATVVLVIGLLRFRKASSVSPTAIVRERLQQIGRPFGIGYEIEEPGEPASHTG